MFRNISIENELVIEVFCNQIITEVFLAFTYEIPKITCSLNWLELPVSVRSLCISMEQGRPRKEIAALRKSNRIPGNNICYFDISAFICPCAPIALLI